MRALLVVSQISFIPSNCYDFLKILLERNHKDIVGLLILENFTLGISSKIIRLYATGCNNLGRTYLINAFNLLFLKREALCKKYNIKIIKAKNINDVGVIKWAKENNLDLIINMRTTCIYKKEILSVPQYGCVNIHHGILPKYRGKYCDLYALYERRPAGFSIHKMTEKIDDGEIYSSKYLPVSKERDYVKCLSSYAPFEASEISILISQIKKLKRMPKGLPNKLQSYIYTSSPTKGVFQDMIRSGVIL